MISEMRDMLIEVLDAIDHPDHGDGISRATYEKARALLAGTEAGADDEKAAWCEVHKDYDQCPYAAPVADGLYAWVRESPRHWERVTESDLSQPADPQKMRADGWFPVYTHPHDASAIEELIAADREFDIAEERVRSCYYMRPEIGREVVKKARERRSKALAALPSPPKEKES